MKDLINIQTRLIVPTNMTKKEVEEFRQIILQSEGDTAKQNYANRTSLCKLVKIDRKHLDSILSMFREKKIVNLSLDNKKHLCIAMNEMPENGSKILRKDVKYQKLYSLANDKFREKVTKNVENNCAEQPKT